MATTMGSIDLKTFKDLRDDVTQYFWFESNSSASYGAGVHITLSPESTFKTSPTGQNILINTDGISIRNGLLPMMVLDNDSLDFNVVDIVNGTYTNVASFGAVSTIGVTDGTQSYLYQDYHSLQMFDKENAAIIAGGGTGNPYFHVSDLRNNAGIYTDVVTVNTVGTSKVYNTTYPIYQIISVLLDGTPVSYSVGTSYITLSSYPQNDQQLVITYTTTSDIVKGFSFGKRTGAIGGCSASFGDNEASGKFSFAFGEGNVASAAFSYAEGSNTKAYAPYSHAEGCDSQAGVQTFQLLGWNSQHAEGYYTQAIGNASHAEGADTKANGTSSHAEGYDTTASGSYSHAEGSGTTASGQSSHAEGSDAEASGTISHAEGYGTTASGWCSHAEGAESIASGDDSHAQNTSTIASKYAQTAIGTCNIEDTSTTTTHPDGDSSHGQYAFIIGNGVNSGARSNALTVDWNGNVVASGSLTASGSPSGLVVEHYTHSFSDISSGSVMSWSESKSKSGYYPLGVVGFRTSRQALVTNRCDITNATNGSCTINMNARAVANVQGNTAEMYVLWVKV